MQTVAVLSLKGGVGKTTVVLGLASAAMRRGVRTLVVDLDPQCNATACLEPEKTAKGLSDVLADPSPEVLRAAVTGSSWGEEVDVLVGSEDAESHNGQHDGKHLSCLTDALSELDGLIAEGELPYQLILLDCPPSLGRLTRSALIAADRALLVTEPTIFAVSGVQRAFEAVQAERQSNNPDLQPLGVIVNRVRPRSHEHQFRIDELRDIFGPLVMPVALPDRLAVQQAQGACMPIHQWGTPGAREVALAFNLLLARTLRAARPRRTELSDDELLDGVE
ncbi:ParA family protein [Saccharopolyspora phatthalungensis]|uniref:Cellulose biosynthesis protein BcsQ n=1 Tax=Saccharopolyspora phatthalungensis TaxID=664693 RepID=A0A840QB81_9PSEU|nr:ParA family protein [Saccharopolyspora phatthalungensis]MBB5155695.1 cellulose biosynthesis protein BcsQ [Saccharopolyspora phatthalungensis]